MSRNSKNPSQNKIQEPVQDSKPVNQGPWTFGYPQCINKQQSRLVCLHQECQKYPFFCSACEDQSCQNQHAHKDRITSIGFKQLIKKLVTQRKAPEQLQKSINAYKTQLQELVNNVTDFVQKQTNSMDQILMKSFQLQQDEDLIVKKLRDKKYQDIKGNELDKVWKKVIPTQQKKKLQKQTIQFIDSKRVEVQELSKNFKDGLAVGEESNKK